MKVKKVDYRYTLRTRGFTSMIEVDFRDTREYARLVAACKRMLGKEYFSFGYYQENSGKWKALHNAKTDVYRIFIRGDENVSLVMLGMEA